MWRYLKAAFLVGVDVPGLGRIPVNALGTAAVGILGFVEPSIWLAGLGIEAALVSSLAFHPRFQKVVDARSADRTFDNGNAKRAEQNAALIAALPQELRARLAAVQATSARILSIYQSLGIEPELLGGTESSLEKLQWIYLKLLTARHHLTAELGKESEANLEARIQQMQSVAISAQAGQSTALQRSQEATLAILHRRLDNLKNRDRILRENDSDLARIEAQIELMRENAAIEGKPASVETEIELASDLASPDLFGSQTSLVRDLDASRR
ncbi:hypothetical protein ACPOL_5558 [Acidisarcina polymorpha]|uniref:Uncharacterized protein n=1 Tax=Acidisarcina polymorpha TaxID=2211140 RepID=A0A2Z5G8C9_9BACT|nr:hypothetical protein [Acidisarcina polymorpha]AXC14806.1 hypothetical protein ACPOL_5558 [Acidisarcina polymorpha]